ncbi:MAG TPA: 4Fe-4S dicluster domain-containing protein [Kofleriaceae bacterium]
MSAMSHDHPHEHPGPGPGDDDDGGEPGGLDRLSRRALFKLAGAGAAAAGLAACSSRPAREILPYAGQPPEVTPGIPLHYATALVEDGFATGLLVASREGRPVKVEGNPDHPASLGATRAIDQAAVLSLFDPQRARAVTERGVPAAWPAIERMLADATARGGAGLHLVLEPTSSPLVIELVGRLRAALPAAGVTFWSPFTPRSSIAGNRLALGRPLQTQLDFRAADVIVALDADLVGDHPMASAYARQIADRRRVVDGGSAMNRLYAIEAGYTPTGVMADHRMRVRGSQIARIAAELLAELQRGGVPAPAAAGRFAQLTAPPDRARWIAAIARDLARVPGRSVVAAGERQPPAVHATVAAINALLGNAGRTVGYTAPVVFEAGGPSHDLANLVRAIDRHEGDGGGVTTLLILGGNPVYTAPADLAVADAISRVDRSLYLGLYDNETARACRFMVPGLHELEQWGAARAYDGTITPLQPLIEPLFGGRGVADVLHQLLGDPPASPRDRLVQAWPRAVPGADLEAALVRGAVANTALPGVTAALAWDTLAPALAAAAVMPAEPAQADGGATLELDIRPHPFVHDGRYTNNPWLLELPEPTTKLTWDNAAQLSPATAARLGVGDGDVIALTIPGTGGAASRTLAIPAILVPGHADGAITLQTGFGRDGGEDIARGIGGNAFRLWTTTAGFHPAARAVALGEHRALAIAQVEASTGDRPIVLSGTLHALGGEAFRDELAGHRGAQPSLYPAFEARGPQWAMSIDLTTCNGCSACVMACAAENNTPVVGKRQVQNRRQMHWLRIDRYIGRYPGGTTGAGIDAASDATAVVQPMLCQHCERAPCEYVCPVEATSHSPDGLNEMTYNRCIGTRFCSNNCPYKVRRFNWFDYKDHRSLRVLGKNPDVTVRDRGVMEKCTYCVQRIRRTEIDARVADRPIGPEEVQTACQQACPTRAITFGSLTDPQAPVVEHRHRPHSYAVLHDQGTVPRTQYLARIRNPNPALDGTADGAAGDRHGGHG